MGTNLQALVMMTLAITLTAAAQTTSTLWKARALDAGKQIEKIQEKLGKISKEDWNSEPVNRVKCEAMLETAFVLHITQEDIVRKEEGGFEFYHLILSGGDAGAFDIAYFYKKGTREPIGLRIDRLPREWHVLLIDPGKIQVMVPKGCVFQFDIKDPFSPQVPLG